MTACSLVAVVFDAVEPAALARFWARALRWDVVGDASGDEVVVVPTDETSFELRFRRVGFGKGGRNPIHFDLTTTSLDDQQETVAALVAMGARHADVGQGPDATDVVLADPEGNELCVIEPDNSFLASCPRLGAVNADGTRALGHFFSSALGWPLVWDQDEETAVQAPDGTGPKVTWSGPPLLPKSARERLHLHLAGPVDGLLELGATRRADSVHGCPGAVPLADVDGNAFCLEVRRAVLGDAFGRARLDRLDGVVSP